MNYLAHIFLSKGQPEIAIGNFIADSVRGGDLSAFPTVVAQGIMLHRYIDTFTDRHDIVRSSKDLIRKKYGHWSGVIVDLYYDHLLAAQWDKYHDVHLRLFVQDFYALLVDNSTILPERVQGFLPIMIEHDWLTSYATIEGISRIFEQMNRRTRNKSRMNFAPVDLVTYYNELSEHFNLFLPELIDYVDSIFPVDVLD